MQPSSTSSSNNVALNTSLPAPSGRDTFGQHTLEIGDTTPTQRLPHHAEHQMDPLGYLSQELKLMIWSFLPFDKLGDCALVSTDWHTTTHQAVVDFWRNRSAVLYDSEIRAELGRKIRTQPWLQRQLMEIVKASAQNSNLGAAPAIAITLLNAARVCFSGMDLRGIRIPEARLEGAVLDSTNLEGADLGGVQLNDAWLRNANLKGSRLEGVVLDPSPRPVEKNALCCYSSDGRLRASYDCIHSVVDVRDLQRGESLLTLSDPHHYPHDLSAAAISDEERLGTADETGGKHKFWYWERSEFIVPNRHKGESGNRALINVNKILARSIETLALSHDGGLLATGDSYNMVRIWNLQSGQCIRSFSGHIDSVSAVTFSFDGKFLASSSDNMVHIWDLQSGECLHTLSGCEKMVLTITFSSDGKFLASGSDKVVRIWNLQSGQCVLTLSGHSFRVCSVAFSSDRKLLASGDFEKVRIWDTESGQCLQTFSDNNWVCTVAFSSDGKFLASGTISGRMRIWDLQNGKRLHSLKLTNRIQSAQFINNDQQLICSNRHIWRWQIDEQMKTIKLQSATRQVFYCGGADLEGVSDLSEKNLSLFYQHGAIRQFASRTPNAANEKREGGQ